MLQKFPVNLSLDNTKKANYGPIALTNAKRIPNKSTKSLALRA